MRELFESSHCEKVYEAFATLELPTYQSQSSKCDWSLPDNYWKGSGKLINCNYEVVMEVGESFWCQCLQLLLSGWFLIEKVTSLADVCLYPSVRQPFDDVRQIYI